MDVLFSFFFFFRHPCLHFARGPSQEKIRTRKFILGFTEQIDIFLIGSPFVLNPAPIFDDEGGRLVGYRNGALRNLRGAYPIPRPVIKYLLRMYGGAYLPSI
jgi:hypothetical protein